MIIIIMNEIDSWTWHHRQVPRVELAAIDLNLLVVLSVLLDERSVTATARRLGRTQSAISHSLGRLRDMFDDPLFVRVGARMQPTPRAETLQAPLAQLLRQTEGLVFADQNFDPALARLRLRLTASDYLQMVLVMPLVAELRELAPGIDVEVAGPGPSVEHGLARGDFELALVVGPQPSSLIVEPLFEDRFMCVVGPRLDIRRLTLKRYASLVHVLVAPVGRSGKGMVDVALAERGLERRIAVVLPDFLAALRLVEEAELITTLPERLLDAVGDAGLRRLRPPLELPSLAISLAWHPRVASDPTIAWLRERIVDLCQRM